MSLPVKRGCVILFNQFTEYAALPNRSGRLRWGFDLRYSPSGQPTERPEFPDFVARSRQHSEQELRSIQQWGIYGRQQKRVSLLVAIILDRFLTLNGGPYITDAPVYACCVKAYAFQFAPNIICN